MVLGYRAYKVWRLGFPGCKDFGNPPRPSSGFRVYKLHRVYIGLGLGF